MPSIPEYRNVTHPLRLVVHQQIRKVALTPDFQRKRTANTGMQQTYTEIQVVGGMVVSLTHTWLLAAGRNSMANHDDHGRI